MVAMCMGHVFVFFLIGFQWMSSEHSSFSVLKPQTVMEVRVKDGMPLFQDPRTRFSYTWCAGEVERVAVGLDLGGKAHRFPCVFLDTCIPLREEAEL